MGAFPSSVHPKNVNPRYVTAGAHFDNPVNLTTEVQLLGAARWEIDIEMQPMSATEAADFGAFIQAHAGGATTFTFDLTPHCPGWSPAPGTKNFRLAGPDIGWDAALAREFGFRFTAIEDI